MAKTSEMIVSKFLKKEDFDEDQICTIKTVKLEEVAQGETKWILYFIQHSKAWHGCSTSRASAYWKAASETTPTIGSARRSWSMSTRT